MTQGAVAAACRVSTYALGQWLNDNDGSRHQPAVIRAGTAVWEWQGKWRQMMRQWQQQPFPR